jgi:Replication initiator protein, pSAM2
VTTAAGIARVTAHPEGTTPVELHWGTQGGVRPIAHDAHRDGAAGDAHSLQVAASLAKYLTKTTEDFGIDGRVGSAADARYLGATHHGVRIIVTAERLAVEAGSDYVRLADRYGTLGYRGHPITKSRRYSVTFGALRRARRHWRQRPPGLDPDADVRQLPDLDPDGDDTVIELREWRFVGTCRMPS